MAKKLNLVVQSECSSRQFRATERGVYAIRRLSSAEINKEIRSEIIAEFLALLESRQ